MKWQTIALMLGIILVGGGTITYTDLFGALFNLSGVEYTHTGDSYIVDGTAESYFNVTTSYWNICFAHYEDGKYENETLFKKVARSRTLHVNLANVDNIITTEPRVEVDWLVPARGIGNWRAIQDGDCWERGKVNKIKIVGKDLEETVKWSFIIGDYVDIDPLWIKDKPSNIIELGVDWVINKTDNEKNLDVNYEILNKTTTKFCVKFKDKTEYLKNLKIGQLINDIPMNKIEKVNNFTVNSKLDLSKADMSKESCFYVNYKELISGLEFKFGWNSIRIIRGAEDYSTGINTNENVVKASDGLLHAVYTIGLKVGYANSTDDGKTWITKNITSNPDALTYAGIVIDGTDNVTVYFINYSNSDIYGIESKDRGHTWNQIIMATGTYDSPSCVTDNDNVVHCCFVDSVDRLYYVSSTTWGSEVSVNSNTVDDTDWCDIEVDSNDCVYITATGTDQNDLDIWGNPCINGWGDGNRVQIFDGSNQRAPTIVIDGNDDIHVAFTNSGDLYWANSTDGTNWDNKKIDKLSSYYVDIMVDDNGYIELIYLNATLTSGILHRANSSTKGVTWTNRTVQWGATKATYPGFQQTRFPASNNLDNEVRLLFTNVTSSPRVLTYLNYTIKETPSVSSCICPSPQAAWEWDFSDNCDVTNCNIGAYDITTTGTGTINCNGNVTAQNIVGPDTGQNINTPSNCSLNITG